MKKKKKMQTEQQRKKRSEVKNMLIGVTLGAVFALIFDNFILGAVIAIIVVTVLEIGTKDK